MLIISIAVEAMLFLMTSFIVLNSISRISLAIADENSDIVCRTASTGCGKCLSAHRDCVWCIDPSFKDEFRCGTSQSLEGTCEGKSLVSQHDNEIQVGPSLDFGTINPQSRLPSQLQPSEIRMTIRPGVGLSFGLKYRHMDSSNDEVYLLNSEIGQGVKIDVTSNCSEQQRTDNDPRSCERVKEGDTLAFNITLTLVDCELSQGDFSVSVGVSGVREITGIFVTPACGCDCEKIDQQELRSEKCSRAGNLICGKCVCQPRKSGKTCEFDGSAIATTTKVPAEDQCRTSNTQAVCSSRGLCVFGRCVCNQLTKSRYYGRYCECDDDSCPRGKNSALCNGNGRCQCNVCNCNPGWTGNNCNCSESMDQCMSSSGAICNDAGYCKCNKCHCYSNSPNSALSHTCEPIVLTTTRKSEPQTSQTYPQAQYPLPGPPAKPKPRPTSGTEMSQGMVPNHPIERETVRTTEHTTTRPMNTRFVATKTETVKSETTVDAVLSTVESENLDSDLEIPFVPPVLRGVDSEEPSAALPEPRPDVDHKHHQLGEEKGDGNAKMVAILTGDNADVEPAMKGGSAALSKDGQGSSGQLAPMDTKVEVVKKPSNSATLNFGHNGVWLVVLLVATFTLNLHFG